MEKIVRLGMRTEYNRKFSVHCKINFNNGKLSITGVEGATHGGNCIGSCGQIDMHLKAAEIKPAPGWDAEKIQKFLDIWGAWHLNDMLAGCEHQRKEWDTEEQVELRHYSWSTAYYNKMKKAESGELTPEEYADYSRTAKAVSIIFDTNSPKWPSPQIQDLLNAGMIEENKTEMKAAGWVRYEEHPEGLLGKPCPTCGYKYGSTWLKEEVPQEVIDFLFSLPDADIQPAWI